MLTLVLVAADQALPYQMFELRARLSSPFFWPQKTTFFFDGYYKSEFESLMRDVAGKDS